MISLNERYADLLREVDSHRAGREIRLIAVSKGQAAEDIEALYRLGHRDFGENYVQELQEKAAALGKCAGIRWHFIGHLQSNKVKAVLPLVHAIHSVDSIKLAGKLAGEASRRLEALRVFLEVNFGEESKTGFSPEEVAGAAREIAGKEGLELLGLMVIPDPSLESKPQFERLCRLEMSCRPHTRGGLSMGMSGDFREALRAGATHIRVGTALFGPRKPAK